MKLVNRLKGKIKRHRNAYRKQKHLKKMGKAYGVDFGGYLSKEKLELEPFEGCSYEASFDLPVIVKRLQITPDDCFIDIGCGKGYAMHYFASLPFGKIAGIEIKEELAKIARDNLKTLYPEDSRFEVIVGDVCKYTDYDEYNYFYLYNPLTRVGISKFVAHLRESLERSPRTVWVIYQNPRFWDEFTKEELFNAVISADRSLILKHQK